MIKVEHLKKTYDTGKVQVEALRDIEFTVKAGEFVSIMGASGSGKSTLMNILGLLDTATEGRYILGGNEVSRLASGQYAHIRNQKIGFVFQTFNLLPRLTAFKNVELPMIYAGVKPAERAKRTLAALDRMGLSERLYHHPNELSGGQNQRVAIARALINNPSIILADEPTGALDSYTSLEIMEIFQSLNREGVTIVLVTHETHISRHAGRILSIKDGHLIKDEKVNNPLDAAEEIRLRGREANL
jgi:putative ABC transport system ATP-binding protein